MKPGLSIDEHDLSFQTLFYYNPQAMWIVDLKTFRFLAVNNATLKQYGYSREEFAKISLKDIRPTQEHEAMENLIKKIKNNQTITGTNLTHIRKDGTLIKVQITSYRVSYHGRFCRMVIINDITERILLNQKLEESFRKVNQTLDSITDGFIIVDKDLKVNYWNKEAEQIFNIPEKTALNKNLFQCCPVFKANVIEQKVEDVVITKHSSTFETFLPDLDKWLLATIYYNNGGLSLLFRDISERKQIDIAIRQKNKKLEQIAFINSHLVRKPLANILGLISCLYLELDDKKSLIDSLVMLDLSASELDLVLEKINLQLE